MNGIMDIIVIGGMIYILFIVLRGFNEQQVKKHNDKLEKRNIKE